MASKGGDYNDPDGNVCRLRQQYSVLTLGSDSFQYGHFIELVVTEFVPIAAYDRYPFAVGLLPVRTFIDITNDDTRFATNKRLQLAEQ